MSEHCLFVYPSINNLRNNSITHQHFSNSFNFRKEGVLEHVHRRSQKPASHLAKYVRSDPLNQNYILSIPDAILHDRAFGFSAAGAPNILTYIPGLRWLHFF